MFSFYSICLQAKTESSVNLTLMLKWVWLVFFFFNYFLSFFFPELFTHLNSKCNCLLRILNWIELDSGAYFQTVFPGRLMPWMSDRRVSESHLFGVCFYLDIRFKDGVEKEPIEKTGDLIWGTVRAHVVLQMETQPLFALVMVFYSFNHRHSNLFWEPRVISASHLSLFSPAAFVLRIPLSPIKAELNLLRGPNLCVLFLQQFEMITQLWCLSVTGCDDRHCNRAGEIVFFHSSNPPTSSTRFPPLLPATTTTTTAVIPLLVSFSSWRDGGACAS